MDKNGEYMYYIIYSLMYYVTKLETYYIFIHAKEDNVVNYFRCFHYIYLKGIVQISERDRLFKYLKGIFHLLYIKPHLYIYIYIYTN